MPVTSLPSRRVTSRVSAPPGSVWVYWEAGKRKDVSRVRDVSMHGVFIETHKPITEGAIGNVHFLVQEGQIRADAVVRHVTNGVGQGMKFTSVKLEDVRHLADLVTRLRHLARERV